MKIQRNEDGTVSGVKLSGRGLLAPDRMLKVDGKTIMTLSNRQTGSKPLTPGLLRKSKAKAATRIPTTSGGLRVLLKTT